MTTPTVTSPRPGAIPGRRRPSWLWRDVDDLRRLIGSVTPNWYASVMGTGIVANAAATLPLQLRVLHVGATVVWALAAAWLLLLTAMTIGHWIRYPHLARGYVGHPVMAHFFGAPPMAVLTIGTGTLLIGGDLLGQHAAIIVDAVCWGVGTGLGLACAGYLTWAMFTRIEAGTADAFGGWLMPVVPPMVSAAAGALLIPYVPAGEARLVMLLACYAMFGLTLFASFVIIVLLWGRLVQHKVGTAAMVPTLWIVLGPLGQSVTAANLLGGDAHLVVGRPLADGFAVLGVLYGVPMMGFALLWAVVATMITVGTARRRLPFSLTWWSFTFPVGTCVTGLSGLAAHTGSVTVGALADLAYLGLLCAWAVVAVRTFHASVISGRLLAPTT